MSDLVCTTIISWISVQAWAVVTAVIVHFYCTCPDYLALLCPMAVVFYAWSTLCAAVMLSMFVILFIRWGRGE